MRFLIPRHLLDWARDNRVLRLRFSAWGIHLEAEFAQPAALPMAARTPDPGWQPPAGLPDEERARQIREHEKKLQEEVLFHSS